MADTFNLDQVLFPPAISRGATARHRFRTLITSGGTGQTQRAQCWKQCQHGWTIGHRNRNQTRNAELLTFFIARRGAERGFWFKDPYDFEAEDQLITTNGTTTVQLAMTYDDGVRPYTHTIYAPVVSTVTMTLNGSPFTDFELDAGSGTVFLGSSIAAEDELLWTGEFYYPVRFEVDLQEITLTDSFIRSWDVPIVELRGKPLVTTPIMDS